MKFDSEIRKAQEHFGKIMADQLERVDRMKAGRRLDQLQRFGFH